MAACLKVNNIGYDYEPKWIITYRLYQQFCFSLNYETMEIGIANRVS